MTISPEFIWTTVGVALVLLAWSAWSSYFVWVTVRQILIKLNGVDGNIRGLRQQLANIIAMMLNAGFKVKRGKPVDWNDNEEETHVLGQSSDTIFDWKKPQ